MISRSDRAVRHIFQRRPVRPRRHTGHVATPAKVERHADLLQRIQTDLISNAAGPGHRVHIARRTDDSLVLINGPEVHRAHEYVDIFISVCRSAGQPIQRTKVLIAV